MANRKRREIDDATVRLLADHGIFHYTFDTTAGNHGRVTFCVGPRKGIVTYPSTASDHRALKNHLAFMRRKIARLRAPEALRAAA